MADVSQAIEAKRQWKNNLKEQNRKKKPTKCNSTLAKISFKVKAKNKEYFSRDKNGDNTSLEDLQYKK